MKRSKLKARFFGQWGEGLACAVLRLKGYRILKRNYRHPLGEIDIIATSKQTVCFVEVKSRQTLDASRQALSPQQQKRIMHAAGTFLSANGRYAEMTLRFDLICVAPFRWPEHIKNAWMESR